MEGKVVVDFDRTLDSAEDAVADEGDEEKDES